MKKMVIVTLVLITLFLFYLTDFADAHGRQGYYGGGRYSAWHGGWYEGMGAAGIQVCMEA
jgi:hypothetical protein